MKKLLIFYLAWIWISCTENPFGGEKKITDRTISGRVKLEKVPFYPEGFHGGVLVWSEGMGLKDITDIDGSFEFVLPAANEHSSGAIVDGDYQIEFFMANYKLETVTITFAGGQIVDDPKTINLEGEFRRDVSMTRIAGVHTVVEPKKIAIGFETGLKVKVTVTPDRTDVYFNLRKLVTKAGSIYTGLLIKDQATDKLMYTVDIDSASTMREYMDRPKKEMVFDLDYPSSNLPRGSYEVIPYFLIERDDVPVRIFDVLDKGYDSFTEKYFHYPLYRTGGEFIIE